MALVPRMQRSRHEHFKFFLDLFPPQDTKIHRSHPKMADPRVYLSHITEIKRMILKVKWGNEQQIDIDYDISLRHAQAQDPGQIYVNLYWADRWLWELYCKSPIPKRKKMLMSNSYTVQWSPIPTSRALAKRNRDRQTCK